MAKWVLEYYPTESVVPEPDGGFTVELAIGSVAWLERLLLRLGPDAVVLDASDGLEATAAASARRLLASYSD